MDGGDGVKITRYGNYLAGTPWGWLSASVTTFAIVLASTALAVLLLSPFVQGEGIDSNGAVTPLMLLVMLIAQVLMVVLVYLAAGSWGARPDALLALQPARGGRAAYIVCLGVMAVGVVVYAILAYQLRPQDLKSDLAPFMTLVRSDTWWWLLLLVVAVGAPLSEEMLFRGFLFPALLKTPLGFLGASVLSSVAWTSLHLSYSPTGLLEIFLIGLFLCAVLWWTGSLWVAIACHGAYNAGLTLFLRFFGGPV
ncbi:MAG: type II CAAX endopeptidase family protein [Pseudomonadota bacterium]